MRSRALHTRAGIIEQVPVRALLALVDRLANRAPLSSTCLAYVADEKQARLRAVEARAIGGLVVACSADKTLHGVGRWRLEAALLTVLRAFDAVSRVSSRFSKRTGDGTVIVCAAQEKRTTAHPAIS